MMDKKSLQTRNSSLDLLRLFALFSVNSVHFLLYTHVYEQGNTVDGRRAFAMVMMRAFFSICVPLFIMLTGYLMSQKTLSKDYYKGITRTLVVYVAATLVYIYFRQYVFDHELWNINTIIPAATIKDEVKLKNIILSILQPKLTGYGWYVEMYIGLFLIAPFLNAAYNGLKNQRQKQILVLTFFVIAILPSFVNTMNFTTTAFWADPKVYAGAKSYTNVMINFWSITIYPLAYYFVGAYIREYGIKLKTPTLIISLVAFLFMATYWSYYRLHNFDRYVQEPLVDWMGLYPFVLGSGVFVLFTRIKANKLPDVVKFGLKKLSDLVFGAYLLSIMFDYILYYGYLRPNIEFAREALPYYFLYAPAVFVCSLAASAVLNLAVSGIIAAFRSTVKAIKKDLARGKNETVMLITFGGLMGAAFIFALWKCYYGFGGNDEPFYLSTAYRFVQGDVVFKHEWNLAQMAFLLHVPFVKLYTMFHGGSTEGIVLTARVCYVIVHAAVCTAMFIRLRKRGYVAMIGVLAFFLFTPYNIMTYSYNSFALDFFALSSVLLATADYDRAPNPSVIVAGVIFAAGVLCSPYTALAYFLFIPCVGVHYLVKKKFPNFVLSSKLFSLKTFLWFSCGVAATALLFLIAVLPRISVSEILESVQRMLSYSKNSDLTFADRIFGQNGYFKSIFRLDWLSREEPLFPKAVNFYILTLAAMLIDRKRFQHRSLYLAISCGLAIFTSLLLLPELATKYYNAVLFPMMFIGITSYILCKEKPREIFAAVFCLGIVYSIAAFYGSDQYFYIICVALTVCAVASFVFAGQLVREMRETEDSFDYAKMMKYASIVLLTGSITLQSGMLISSKKNHCFWDEKVPDLKTEIEEGPAKGIMTTEIKAETYSILSKDIEYYQGKEGKLLVFSNKSWIYLSLDNMECSSFSTWIGDDTAYGDVYDIPATKKVVDELNDYYKANPDKIPDYIYVPRGQGFRWNIYSVEEFIYKLYDGKFTSDKTGAGFKYERRK